MRTVSQMSSLGPKCPLASGKGIHAISFAENIQIISCKHWLTKLLPRIKLWSFETLTYKFLPSLIFLFPIFLINAHFTFCKNVQFKMYNLMSLKQTNKHQGTTTYFSYGEILYALSGSHAHSTKSCLSVASCKL